jgi:hypothetical protein
MSDSRELNDRQRATWRKRFWQQMHRHGRIEKYFNAHSTIPCLLARRTSEEPHFEHVKCFRAPTLNSILLSMRKFTG